MKVLLIMESITERFPYIKLPPLGLLYIASFLESKGINVDVKDYNVQRRRKINLNEYNLIGYSLHSGNVENTLKSINKMKKQKKNLNIIVGGPHVKVIAKRLIKNPKIECLIDGEGEETIYEYIKMKDKSKVKGIWIRKNSKPFFTGKRKPIMNLDKLPFPAIEKVPYKRYNAAIKKRKPICSIITSRGCSYNCIFCYHSLGFKYRERSPENVVKEIEWLRNNLGIKELWIADDNFVENKERVKKICDLIIKKKIDITFSLGNGARADKLDEKLLKKLKKAGCWFLSISPESGCKKTIEKINKGISIEDIIKVVKICKKIDIKIMVNFIIGFPWEDEKEIKQTINFGRKLDPDILNIQKLIPYPETPIGKRIEDRGYFLRDEKKNFKIEEIYHPSLNEKKILEFIKKTNKKFYTPKKIFNLFKMLGPEGFILLTINTFYKRI
jgi:anaerobic magnesium-protoporphyrin IX monomethyl ester cyclase